MPGRGKASSGGVAPETVAAGRVVGRAGPAAANNGVGRERAGGVGRERVSEIQRARILSAMVDVAAQRGLANVTVAHVVARSGVSRRTFYELFEDREDCFLAALEEALTQARGEVVTAYGSGGRWAERIRAGLLALLRFFDDEPATGRLLVVESLGAGPRALELRKRALERIIAAVDDGRRESKPGASLPSLTAEGVAGAVFSVIHTRLLTPVAVGPSAREGEPRGLVELTGPLMGMIVLPYLGPAAARREAQRTHPQHTIRTRRAPRDPLQDLEMRLTYRTMRVLIALAAHPGASNRHIADQAGISDQGQTSKLLGRLQTLGLIEKTSPGQARGAPNSWQLTTKGQQLEHAITKHNTN